MEKIIQEEETELLSNCCGALPHPLCAGIYNGLALCAKCGEWADFTEVEETTDGASFTIL